MNIFDQNSILPGVVTNIISSYAKGYDSSLFGTTDSVVIVGTAFNGPVGIPFPVYGPEHAKYVFGPTYDPASRKAATLVTAIEDCWSSGCRTIYAVRISGKEMYKDYQLKCDTNLKLRIGGIFPSNSNKELSLLYDDSSEMNIKIFKPAERATIDEKNQGTVESKDSVIECFIDLYNSGLSKDSKLIDLIKMVNEFTYNNVLRLTIVDNEGNDVTQSSFEAKGLKIEDMFPGLYLIGRNKNNQNVKPMTDVNLMFKEERDSEGLKTIATKNLNINTDITTDYPIFAKNVTILSDKLGMPMLEKFDFLKVPGKIDLIYAKDKIDYEEVELNDFEIYKRLGQGFATTAHCEVIKDDKTGVIKKVKVLETEDKALSRVALVDGIYSSIQGLKAKYRVVEGIYADTKIKAKKPRAIDFKKSLPEKLDILKETISMEPVIAKNDLTDGKPVVLEFVKLDEAYKALLEKAKNLENVYYEKTVKEVSTLSSVVNKEYKKGSLFLISSSLYMYDDQLVKINGEEGSIVKSGKTLFICQKDGTYKEMQLTDIDSKEFVIVQTEKNTFSIANVKENSGKLEVEIIATVDQILNQEDEYLVTKISDTYEGLDVKIISSQFDYLTAEELATILEEDKDFSKILTFEVKDKIKAQDYIEDLFDKNLKYEMASDRIVGYDTNLYIPYRTDDNFARHLAQHCTVTSIKTGATHGFIGVKPLLDTSLPSIANKASEIVSLKLESGMIGKKDNGSNLLNKDNIPYHIGRKISIIATQYILTMDNYQCIQNGAARYAGLVSVLPPDVSSTCQSINIPNPMFEFTTHQLEKLTASGIVTVKKSYNKNWVITDGVTMAQSGDPMKRLSASKIADSIESIIRSACEPFIGKQNHLTNQNALRTSIKASLEDVKDILIEGYEFKIIIDPNNTRLGIINIDYTILPIYEIKTISNTINVK